MQKDNQPAVPAAETHAASLRYGAHSRASAARVSAGRRKAILTRHKGVDAPETRQAAREWAVLVVEEVLIKVLAEAPSLRRSDLERLLAHLTEAAQ